MTTMQTIPAWVTKDPEWASAIYLLTWNRGIWASARHHVDFTGGSIDFEAISDQPWSSGECLLIKCAWSLFNSNWVRQAGHAVGLGDLASTLSPDWLDAVLHALAIRTQRAALDVGVVGQ